MNSKLISRRSFIGNTGAVVSGLTVFSESVIGSINPQGFPDDLEVKSNMHNELNGPIFSSGKSDEQDLPPVYAAYYAHCGIILWGLKGLKSILETQYNNLEQFSDYRCGWDHEAYTYDYLAENDPKTLADMVDALKRFSCRLGVGSSTYGQPLSAFIDGESNIRQLTFAMDTTEKHLGYPISVYIMSEHPFHPQLPQLLYGAGFKGAILRTHFSMYGHNPSCKAPVVWWAGVDGSQILALPTYPGQDTGPVGKYHRVPGWGHTIDSSFLGGPPTEERAQKVEKFRSRFGSDIMPLIVSHADDGPGMPGEEGEKDKVSRDWQHILIEDILHLLPQPRISLQTGANDFSYRMPWGYCGNWMWNQCRDTEVRIQTAERLAAIGNAIGGNDFEPELEAAWKNLLVAQHHDIQICGLEDEARKFLNEGLKKADNIINQVLEVVSPQIGKLNQTGRTIIFNPLPWERTSYLDDTKNGRLITVPGLGFKSVDHETKEAKTGTGVFTWASESHFNGNPPSVWKTDNPARGIDWERRDPGRLTTPFYEILTAPDGGFWILNDLSTGQRLFAPPKSSGTLSGIIEGRECESVSHISEPVLKDNIAILGEEGQIGGIPYRMTWTFYSHTPRIDWHGEFEFARQWIGRTRTPVPAKQDQVPDNILLEYPATVPGFNDHEYKLRLRFFPYVGPKATGIRDMPFHIAETNDMYVQGLYFTAVSDGLTGLAVFNKGLMGSIRESDGAFSVPLAFSLPYIWGTRILNGVYTYDLGILPFIGNWRDAGLLKQALDFNYPPVIREESRTGKLRGDLWKHYEETGNRKAILSALFTRQGKTFTRFYEHQGKEADVAFSWMGKPAKLTSVDFMLHEQGSLGSKVRLLPWQVQTLRFDGM